MVVVMYAAALVATMPAVSAQAPLEDDVKAAFLLNFTRYVEWPAGVVPAEGSFRICMLSSASLSGRMQALAAGESAAGRPLEVVRVETITFPLRCQVLFVDSGSTAQYVRSAAAIRKLPVLTVGEDRTFHDAGGVIRLFLDGSRFRFTVHAGHAQNAGLHISARLLRLAREVFGLQP